MALRGVGVPCLDDIDATDITHQVVVDADDNVSQLAGNAHAWELWADDVSTGTHIARLELVNNIASWWSQAPTWNIGNATYTVDNLYTAIGDTRVGYSASGVLSGDAGFTFNAATDTLTLGTNHIYSQGAHGLTLAADDWAVGSGSGNYAWWDNSAGSVILAYASGVTGPFVTFLHSGVAGVNNRSEFRFDFGSLGTTYARVRATQESATTCRLGFSTTNAGSLLERLRLTPTGELLGLDTGGLTVNQWSTTAGTSTVFNEQGADIDHRWEGDTNTNLFVIDAGLDAFAFGTAASSTYFGLVSKTWTITSGTGITFGLNPTSAPASAGTATIYGFDLTVTHTTAFDQTRLVGAQMSARTDAAASAGTLGNLESARCSIIHNGAIAVTSAIELYIVTPTKGGGASTPTIYTQLRLDDTGTFGTTNIAIRQRGTNAHNRFQGGTKFGADSAPNASYAVDVAGALLGSTFLNYGGTTLASDTGDAAFGTATAGHAFWWDQSLRTMTLGTSGSSNYAILKVHGWANIGDAVSAAVADGDFAAGSSGTYLFLDESADQLDFVSNQDSTLGPVFRLYHNEATPTANDVVGRLLFDGRDANSANLQSYARIDAIIDSPTDTSEDGRVEFYVAINATLTERFAIYQNECRAIAGLVAGSDAAITSGYVLDAVGAIRGTTYVNIGGTTWANATGEAAFGTSTDYMSFEPSTTPTLLVESDDAGNHGPYFQTFQNSASPAAADIVVEVRHTGKETGGGSLHYGAYRVVIDNAAVATAASHWEFDTFDAGPIKTATLAQTGVWTDASSLDGKSYVGAWRWPAGSAIETIRRLDLGVYHGRGAPDGPWHVSPSAEVWRDVTGLRGTRVGLAAKDLAGLALMGVRELAARVDGLERENRELKNRLDRLAAA